ncbi:unnamed protein product [Chilo suppressalis]|uniref:DUF659 domain-containing protein n=1 Tax=Chilo suppressalis TaxID=168631 RepID=A0ABN8BDE5_CHISP|nr:unnamed protein product [Chilo suppressalis]
MAKIKNKKTREEKLAQARRHKKEKYEELKKDPIKYAEQKEKERLRYLKRKEQNKIKNIKDLTPRQQRLQRKKWRENAKKYTEKKKRNKQIEQMLIENSPPTSDSEEVNARNEHPQTQDLDPLEGSSEKKENLEAACTDCIQYKRKLRRLRYLHVKKLGILKKKLERERNERKSLNKKLERVRFDNKRSQKNNPSTEEKVDSLISNINENSKEQIKKKLIFGEVLKKELTKGFQTLKKKDRRQFSNIVVKDRENFKKHKILLSTSSFTVRNSKLEAEIAENNIKQDVNDFFEEDDNSRLAADKKEYIKKGRITKQKRYLSDTLINLHKKFLATHSYALGYSTFCRIRPFWIVYPKESNRNTCSCIVHINMDLLIKSLQKHKIIRETNGSLLLESLCCDIRSENCLSRRCETCSKRVINYLEFENNKYIKYHEWGTQIVKYNVKGEDKYSKKTTKLQLQDLPRNLIKKLEDSLPRYLKHSLNVIVQYKNIDALKKSLTPKEVLIHMDFSENYNTKFHEEVQSRHFGSSPEQITLHTSVSYLIEPETGLLKTYSMCTVSDCCRHDAEAIWAHVIPILEHVKDVTHIDTVHFLTDSPSSQYRNRKIFYIISQLQQQFPELKAVSWNYLESGHGKGAPDGIGAVIKRTADSTVRFGNDLGTLQDFWNILKLKIKNVELRMITYEDIEDKKIPKTVKMFKGTMQVHQVLWSSSSLSMTFRKLSCFFCPNGCICTHGYHLGYMDILKDVNYINQQQDQILQEFLDSNTTPELIENSSERILAENVIGSNENLEGKLTSKHIDPLAKITKSPKVTILSDVRLDWTNTPFYKPNQAIKTCATKNFFNAFTEFITNEGQSSSTGNSLKETYKIKSVEDKENEIGIREYESSDDDEFKIF